MPERGRFVTEVHFITRIDGEEVDTVSHVHRHKDGAHMAAFQDAVQAALLGEKGVMAQMRAGASIAQDTAG